LHIRKQDGHIADAFVKAEAIWKNIRQQVALDQPAGSRSMPLKDLTERSALYQARTLTQRSKAMTGDAA
jgi:hypothetical protein